MKFSINCFFTKCNEIHRKLRTWSHLLKKSLLQNFIFLCRETRNTSVKTKISDKKMCFDKILKSLTQYCKLNNDNCISTVEYVGIK